MKNKLLAILILLSSYQVQSDPNILNSDNAPFIYEAYTEIKAPREDLASLISRDFRKANDEFTKHDLFLKINPVIDKRINEFAGNRLFTLRVRSDLGKYDFERKAFKTGFSDQTYIPFQHRYAATFTNAKKVEYIPMPFEAARALSSKLAKDREAIFEFIGELVSAKEGNINYKTSKIIELKMTKFSVVLKPDTKIGEVTFK